MSKNITIRLDERLAGLIDDAVRRSGRPRSEVVREALRRQLGIETFRSIREQLIPLAEAQGWYTDDDVFDDVS
jgi:Arc/MetJ-type ribon-helix-helix transcriptional regulator